MLVVGFALTIAAGCLEYTGERSSITLYCASIVSVVTGLALGRAAAITVDSTMRTMAWWPGISCILSWVASGLILAVSYTERYHSLPAELSLLALIVSGIFQFVYGLVWFMYVGSGPDTVAPKERMPEHL